MISSKEAEGMDYLTYKRVIWSRLIGFWNEHAATGLSSHEYVADRLNVCSKQLAIWNASR